LFASKKIGSVEILIEINNRSWGLQLFMLPPLPLGHPTIAITPDKVEIYPKKEGVKGMPSLGCFPLWGREGGIHQAVTEREGI